MNDEDISSAVLSWLNQYPDKPSNIVDYEYLADDRPGMALSVIQSAYKTKQYIYGGFEAQYQFAVVYRTQTGTSSGTIARLRADETLNRLGAWASARKDLPVVGAGVRVKKVAVNSPSALLGRYENGDEDHQILMTMTYEVI